MSSGERDGMVTRGEGRKFKAYEKRAQKINAIEPEMELGGRSLCAAAPLRPDGVILDLLNLS